jgi:hypothetical protein
VFGFAVGFEVVKGKSESNSLLVNEPIEEEEDEGLIAMHFILLDEFDFLHFFVEFE